MRVELNREKAAALRDGELSPAECERRRQTALDLDLGRHLATARARRWAERNWTPEQEALLGTAPDTALAE